MKGVLKKWFAVWAAIVVGTSSTRAAHHFQPVLSLGATNDNSRVVWATLTEGSDGAVYGVCALGGSQDGGTLFRLNKNGDSWTVVHSFGANGDGREPDGALIEGREGMLYGTTYSGGNSGSGTVYAVKRDGSDYAVLHSFGSGSDGKNPPKGLVEGSDGMLYGVTLFGGSGTVAGVAPGTIFRLSKDGSSYSILRNFTFQNQQPGIYPMGALMEASDGYLYGTTTSGGTNSFGGGTLFKLAKDGSEYSVLRDFGRAAGAPSWDGNDIRGRLIEARDGALYGTSGYGGTNLSGTVFKINRDGTDYAVLHHFGSTPTDGKNAYAELVEGQDGVLYGTTYNGGDNGKGTIFALNRDGSGYEVLHSFGSTYDSGQNPNGGLIRGKDGILYGATSRGGDFGYGLLFRLYPRQTPVILSLRISGNGAEVGFAGIGGQRYAVFHSTDLHDWVGSVPITMPPTGIYTNLDQVPLTGQAWYRVGWLP